jgi:hypothetical protein
MLVAAAVLLITELEKPLAVLAVLVVAEQAELLQQD